MNRSAAAIGIGVLAIAVIVGVILFLQLPSPDQPTTQAQAPVGTPALPPVEAGAADTARPPTPAPQPSPVRGPATAMEPGTRPPTFDVVRVDKKGNVVVAGKAGPDCAITVRSGETVVGTANADRRGDWVIVPGHSLAPGESQLTLSAKCGDAAPVEAERVVVLIVPDREIVVAAGQAAAPGSEKAPVQTATADQREAAEPIATAGQQEIAKTPPDSDRMDRRADSRTIAVAVPRDASKPAVILQSGTTADGVSIGSVDYDDKGKVVVTGTAEPGSAVQVYLDNRIIGLATADGQGRWQLAPEIVVEPGRYTVRADRVQPDGKVVARVEIPFLRGDPLTDLPEGRIVVIQPGDHLWKIARASYGAGTRYTLIYDANRRQISDPDLIYPGQVFRLPRVN